MPSPRTLRFTSIQAPIHDFIIRDLADYTGDELDAPTEFVAGIPWQARERMLDEGEIDVAWICGRPYVLKRDRPDPLVELLAAPVMAARRYGGRSVYFSDVIVCKGTGFHGFADLRGATWAYNEPGSHSGFGVTQAHLAEIGERSGFFGGVIAAGSHQRAVAMVLAGEADAAAIDSTVLESVAETEERVRTELRVIATFGPSPIPPLVVRRGMDPGLRKQLRTAVLQMHHRASGRERLTRAGIQRLVSVHDRDYDSIREMWDRAAGVDWGPTVEGPFTG